MCASIGALLMTGGCGAAGAPAVAVPHAPIELPAGFTAQTTLLGRVLADHKGRTLYSSTRPPGRTEDAGWAPVEAPWLAIARAPWSTAPLPGGGRQWVYRGRALFRYAQDKDPQDVRGHGRDGGWTAIVLEPPPPLPRWATLTRVDIGWVFANEQGLTVYAPARPGTIAAAQTCPEECMRRYWRPVLASPEDRSVGRWQIVVNGAGQRQWTYDNRPLYTHTRDTRPGEMRGNSFAVGYAIGDGFRVIPVSSQLPQPGA